MTDPHASPRTRVLVVDTHTKLRMAIRAFLRSHPEVCVVGEAATPQDAATLAATREVDVVVVDFALCADGDLIATLKACQPNMRVVVLSIDVAAEYARRARRLGADAYIDKGDVSALFAAITQTAIDPPPADAHI